MTVQYQAVRVKAERGVALGIVVWFIAGMALLVSGIIAEAKIDTRLAQLHYFRAQSVAAGDGAIHLAMAEQVARKQSGQQGSSRSADVQIGGNIVAIRIIPSALLVNISTENVRGLSALFAHAESFDENDGQWQSSSEQLARSVIAYRDGSAEYRGSQFFSLEDLMRVPGIDRGVYDAVRDYIVTESLAGTPAGQNQNKGNKLTSLQAAMTGEGALLDGNVQHRADMLRVDAVVELGGQQWLRRRWVATSGGERSGLPWKIIRSEASRPLKSGGIR